MKMNSLSRRDMLALGLLAAVPLDLLADLARAAPAANSNAMRTLDRFIAGYCAAMNAPGLTLGLASAAGPIRVSCHGYADLAAARKALDDQGLSVPLLAKEFIVDPLQLEWARHHGADAVLLIVRILDKELLGRFIGEAKERGLAPFVEVTTEDERDAALEAGADVLGVNARDLDTQAIEPARAARVIAGIPRDRVAVHLSGLGSAEAVKAVRASRADAALVGAGALGVDVPAMDSDTASDFK